MRVAPNILARPEFRFELNSVNQIASLELRAHALYDVC
jgi:hypothetical protein